MNRSGLRVWKQWLLFLSMVVLGTLTPGLKVDIYRQWFGFIPLAMGVLGAVSLVFAGRLFYRILEPIKGFQSFFSKHGQLLIACFFLAEIILVLGYRLFIKGIGLFQYYRPLYYGGPDKWTETAMHILYPFILALPMLGVWSAFAGSNSKYRKFSLVLIVVWLAYLLWHTCLNMLFTYQ